MAKYFRYSKGISDGVVRDINPYRFNGGEIVHVDEGVIRIDATDEQIAEWVGVQNCNPVELGEAEVREFEVPKVLTPRQARLTLLNAGLLDDIETLIANDRSLGIWWEYSLDIHRDHPELIAAAQSLNLTDAQVDQLFVDGEKL